MPALRASLQTVSSQRDPKARARLGGAVTALPALPPPPPPNHSSLSFLSTHSLSSSGLIPSSPSLSLLFPSFKDVLSFSFSSLLSQPPPSIHTLGLLAVLSKISIPCNTGLPVTSYFIQLGGIKAIKSKRSRQAPVKLRPYGPHPCSPLSLFFFSLPKRPQSSTPTLLALSLAGSPSCTHCWVRKSQRSIQAI